MIRQSTHIFNILSSLPGSIYWKDKKGIYKGGNALAVKMAGLNSIDELIGKTDYDLFPKKQADQFRENDLRIMNSSTEYSVEEKSYLPNGEVLIQLSTKKPLRDKNNKIIGIIGSTVDVTPLKNIEQQLMIAKETAIVAKATAEKETLKKQAQMYKRLSATVAHEMLTPLKGIELGIRYLNKYFPQLTEGYRTFALTSSQKGIIPDKEMKDLQETLNEIITEVKESFLFIEMLLGNIRFEGITERLYQKCFILDAVKEALNRYPFNASQKQIIKNQVEYNFNFKGNQELLVHVLFNLFKNSLYYIEKAGKGDITIWTEKTKTRNELHFKDTGQGIAAEVLPHIFEQFYSKTFHGTGIGLTYSKMVMESFGGNITCKSTEGEYAEFILSFPKLTKITK